MKYLAIILSVLLVGCPDRTPTPISPVTRVTTNPLPEATSEGSYELEILFFDNLYLLDANQAAHSVRTAIQGWLEIHRGRKIVSIVPVPYSGENNCISHLIIVSEPKGKQ